MQEIVRFLAENLVEDHSAIEIREEDETLLLVVADNDLGSVIGRRGMTARAIRSVVKACGGPYVEVTSPGDERSRSGGS
jgi:predicted RNA-binding protein YlqC (UPF0109 family)